MPEEETIGVHTGLHASGIELEEGLNTSTNRNHCANCRRNVHCFVKIDKDTREAIIHKTCKNEDCECKCRTHFACRNCGYLHPYGVKCTFEDLERVPNAENDKAFEKIMSGWRDSRKEDSVPKVKEE